MRWFKHLTGSLKDPMISDLISEFGGDGYLVFFGILDMMAEDFDESNPGVSTFSLQYLTRNLQVSRQKLVRILTFLQNYSKNNGKLLHVINGDKITITCKRLEELADNWTHRILRSNSVVPTAQEVEEEVEEDNKKQKIYTSENFISFYDNYPKHVEKKEALKQWILLNNRKDVPIPGDLNKIVNKQIECGVLNTEDRRKFCMSPRRWLFGDRWQDEIIRKKEYTGKKYKCKTCGILKENEVFLNQPDMVMNNEPFYTCNFCSGKATET